MLADDMLANVLYIDLTKKSYKVVRRAELFDKYLGGAGVAAQLLLEECPEKVDALSADNPVVFAVGPLTGLYPLASKTVAMFKSPHTGNLGESHCGGRSAVAIRMAGYGAIVIKGASDIPVYLSIQGNQIYFRDASSIWGMHNSITAGRIIREAEPHAGFRTIMRIGGAGERLVSYACVTTETYRHFGRLGLGAVFGSKKLKAVVVSGKRSLATPDIREYRQVYDEIFEAATSSVVMKKYHDLGTAENVLPLNQIGGFPTRNLRQARFEGAEKISGEAFAGNYLGRRLACSHCPVGCIHIGALREPHPAEPFFYKTSMISYDYEPIYALGSMLGISEAGGLLKLIDLVEMLGLDAMSTGVILAWATEAQERKLISLNEIMDIKLSWGDCSSYMQAIRLIVEQPNDFYRALARGVDHASNIYGGRDFALAFGGNEMPGYHTGPGAYAGILIGARHSHLDNAGYSFDQKVAGDNLPEPMEMVSTLLKEEHWRQVLSSLVICFFARGIYLPEVTLKALQTAGFDLSADDLLRIGKEIHANKYRFKIREGFDLDLQARPKRIFETSTPLGNLDNKYLSDALISFKKLMGFN